MPRCTCAPRHLRLDVPTHPHPCVHPNLHLSPPWRISAPRHHCSHPQAHQVHLRGALSACTQQCIPVLTHQHTGASRHKCTHTLLHPCKGGPNTHTVSRKCVYAAVHLCMGTPNALTPCSHAPRHNTAVQGRTDGPHALTAQDTHAQTQSVRLPRCSPRALLPLQPPPPHSPALTSTQNLPWCVLARP